MSQQKNEGPITYASTGVNYEAMDPFKRLAQLRAAVTGKNLERLGMQEVPSSRGESAYVWKDGNKHYATVIEGLGTKNLVADQTRQFTGRTHYDSLAQDTVAMIVNDLITLGADPFVINAYFAVGSSDWFNDEERANDLVNGWGNACDLAGASWGGGETPTLKGIIDPNAIDLSGSAIGVITDDKRLLSGVNLVPGDAIMLVESNGIHANGLTLARTIAANLPKGYETILPDGRMYGDTLLDPTHIYADLMRQLYAANVEMHYTANITGHGFRKIMRAEQPFTYILDNIPDPQPVFQFIQEHSNNDDKEMYGNYNMGAGFALFMPPEFVQQAQKIAAQNFGWKTWNAGYLEEGPRQVFIRPKGITFDTLGVR